MRLVLAVPDARLAELIGKQIGCWVLPTGQDIDVVVIVASPDKLGTAKVASYLANAGYPEGITEFPEIHLGYRLKGETPQ